MATGALVSLGDYLANSYEPDCEYVDGELLARNLGEIDHGSLQPLLVSWLMNRREELGIFVLSDTRTQVAPNRFMVPDIAVTVTKPKGRILTTPPFVCCEILSPEDRIAHTEVKIDDYLNFGVAYVWMIDPRNRMAWTYTRDGRFDCPNTLSTSDPKIELPIGDLFTELYRNIDPD